MRKVNFMPLFEIFYQPISKLLEDKEQYIATCTLVYDNGVLSDVGMCCLWQLEYLFETDEYDYKERRYLLMETIRRRMIGFPQEGEKILECLLYTIQTDTHREHLLDIFKSYIKGRQTLQL